MAMEMESKYHAISTVTSDGIKHDSRREARRWCELRLLEKSGAIRDLQRQVPFELIPAQYEEIPTGEVYQRGERKGERKVERVCAERAVAYIADFVYTDAETGKTVVEDTKGHRTTDYIIKRKLMRYVHGIKIREI